MLTTNRDMVKPQPFTARHILFPLTAAVEERLTPPLFQTVISTGPCTGFGKKTMKPLIG